jgi:Fe-S-cluster-containing hydrogenase component 2
MYLHADSQHCSGCRACLLACSLHLVGENDPKTAALSIIPHFPAPGNYEVQTCTECGVCAEVCPLGAVYRNGDGTYVIDPELCCYCGVCVVACPEQVIGIHADAPAPFKCDLCGECIPFCGMNVLSLAAEEATK